MPYWSSWARLWLTDCTLLAGTAAEFAIVTPSSVMVTGVPDTSAPVICTVRLVLGFSPNGTSTEAVLVIVPMVRTGARSGPMVTSCTDDTAVVTTLPSSFTRLWVFDAPPPRCRAPGMLAAPPMALALADGLPSAMAWRSRALWPFDDTPLEKAASDL